jgi:hypothetical protein
MTISTERLMPCPFCGADATAYHAFPEFEEGWHVACQHADDCILAQAHGMMPCEASEALIVVAWNRRSAGVGGPGAAAGCIAENGQYIGPFTKCSCGNDKLELRDRFWCCTDCGASYGEHAGPTKENSNAA